MLDHTRMGFTGGWKLRVRGCAFCLLALFALRCGDGDGNGSTTPEPRDAGSGGSTSATGGSSSSGGNTTTGGSSGSGGNTTTGGSSGNGGAETGGTRTTGGDASTAPEGGTCAAGFEANDSGECVDVDECALNLDDCDGLPDACVNVPGSFECHCPGANIGDGKGPDGCTCARADYSPLCEPWTEVGASMDHVCGISGGALFCWGANDWGQLGLGDRTGRQTPTRVGTDTGWTAIAPGSMHTCGVRGGALYCWGGGFGLGTNTRRALAPKRVGTASDWTTVTAGIGTTCALRAGGTLYCWGSNSDGTAGIGMASTEVVEPAQVALTACTSVSLETSTVTAVCGGKLYGWGAGNYLGYDAMDEARLSPTQLGTATDWASVGRGMATACAIKTNGAIWCWGTNQSTTPALNPSRSDWRSVVAGRAHACGITQAGNAYCWGENKLGQLGDGTANTQASPRLLRDQCTRMAATWDTTFAIFDGGLYAFGGNQYGIRGVPVVPRRIENDSDWTDVSLVYNHACGIRNGGALYCWGAPQRRLPTMVSVTPVQQGSAKGWTHVSVGLTQTCAIQNGKLFCWGRNREGEIGNGTTPEQPDPLQVGTDSDWIAVDTGDGVEGSPAASAPVARSTAGARTARDSWAMAPPKTASSPRSCPRADGRGSRWETTTPARFNREASFAGATRAAIR